MRRAGPAGPAGSERTGAAARGGPGGVGGGGAGAARGTAGTFDGPGIPPALLPHVFERFARGDASRSRAAGSTGLGLAIVRAVAEAYGGPVEVASAPGRTEFTVRLPATERSSADGSVADGFATDGGVADGFVADGVLVGGGPVVDGAAVGGLDR